MLGRTKLGSAAATSSVVTIPAREMLVIQVNVTGYSSTDIASFRFNGDTAANYNSFFWSFTSGTTTYATQSAAVSQTMLQTGKNAVTGTRQVWATVQNFNATQHPVNIQSITGSAAGTAPVLSVGGGTWNSAAASQITSVQLVMPGSANMNTGTSMIIWGMNPT